MARVRETLFSCGETATVLRAKLGAIREWSDTLADMRRHRTTVKGETLMPHLQARIDGNLRPQYRGKDIEEFIRRVIAMGAAVPGRIKGRLFEFDDEPPHPINWKFRTEVPLT